MKNELDKKGHYELYETTEGHELLSLGKNDFYAVIETKQGHILVNTDEDHEKQKTIQKGSYYLMDVSDDPSFTDMPHLFLEKGNKYQELLLPKGLPNNSTIRKKVIFTDASIDEAKIKRHLKNNKEKILQEESLESIEKKELDRQAKRLKIKGFSNMKKQELIRKIKKVKKDA